MIKYLKNICFLFIVVLSTSCARQEIENDIPNVAVDQYVYLSNPSSFNLNVQGGWIEHTGGYKGLIIYRRYYNLDANDFIAYETACPLHWSQGCTLSVEDNTYLVCSCEDEKFVLFDGSPLTNASQNVKFYRTIYDGVNVIRISN